LYIVAKYRAIISGHRVGLCINEYAHCSSVHINWYTYQNLKVNHMDNTILLAIGKAYIVAVAIVGLFLTHSLLVTDDRLFIQFFLEIIFLSLDRF